MGERPKLEFSVTPSKLIGLLDLVHTFGGRIDLARISVMLQTDVDDLLPVVDAAEMFGLIKVVDGDLELTDKGREFVFAHPSKKKLMLREIIKNIEPFSTLIKLIHEEGEYHIEKLFEDLDKIKLFDEEYIDANTLHLFILEWLLYTEIVEYNGDEKKYFKKS